MPGYRRLCTPCGVSARLWCEPVACRQEVHVKLLFGAARFGVPVVFPANPWRQGHQDGFRAPAGLQAKQGAPVVYQVELDVTTAPVVLETALPFTEVVIPAPCDDRQVGLHEMIPHAFQQSQVLFEVTGVVVVEKQAPDTAGFVAVPDEKNTRRNFS